MSGVKDAIGGSASKELCKSRCKQQQGKFPANADITSCCKGQKTQSNGDLNMTCMFSLNSGLTGASIRRNPGSCRLHAHHPKAGAPLYGPTFLKSCQVAKKAGERAASPSGHIPATANASPLTSHGLEFSHTVTTRRTRSWVLCARVKIGALSLRTSAPAQ